MVLFFVNALCALLVQSLFQSPFSRQRFKSDDSTPVSEIFHHVSSKLLSESFVIFFSIISFDVVYQSSFTFSGTLFNSILHFFIHGLSPVSLFHQSSVSFSSSSCSNFFFAISVHDFPSPPFFQGLSFPFFVSTVFLHAFMILELFQLPSVSAFVSHQFSGNVGILSFSILSGISFIHSLLNTTFLRHFLLQILSAPPFSSSNQSSVGSLGSLPSTISDSILFFANSVQVLDHCPDALFISVLLLNLSPNKYLLHLPLRSALQSSTVQFEQAPLLITFTHSLSSYNLFKNL